MIHSEFRFIFSRYLKQQMIAKLQQKYNTTGEKCKRIGWFFRKNVSSSILLEKTAICEKR